MSKTIFITGAAKRIGKEIALTYKELGWNIIIHYNSSKKDAEDLADFINKIAFGLAIWAAAVSDSE